MIVLKKNWKTLLFCIGLPLAVGGLSALLSMDAMKEFSQVKQPPLSPPSWLFPVAWTILYTLMGLAAYFVQTSGKEVRSAMTVYYVQLAANFIWPLLFFVGKWYLLSFFWLLLLWVLVLNTLLLFRRISRTAGNLLIPYLLWLTFAAYLNLGVAYLN